MATIIDTLSQYYFFLILIVVLISLYLYDKYWCKTIGQLYYPNAFSYGYSGSNGPCRWKDVFPAANGERQSPINIVDRCAISVPAETVCPLNFSPEFHCMPSEMKLHNDGNSLLLCAQWACQKRPHLSGGPLEGNYRFVNLRFRWGPNDYEGSEHMLNCTRYAMEVQAAFVKTSMKRDEVLEAARCGWLVMLSYVFMVTPIENPYLEPIIKAVHCLKCPFSYVSVQPVIISLLMPEFYRDYYSYIGSLSYPPCTEGVRWIVKPEPLMISSGQLDKFRKLHGVSGVMDNNTRPVQMVNNRDVTYYD